MTAAAATLDLRARARATLLECRTAAGRWEGRLSSSALSTATAVLALGAVGQRRAGRDGEAAARLAALERGGIDWLIRTQNDDGGWGDTTTSATNVSTTALCWAALGTAAPTEPVRRSLLRAERWLENASRGLAPRQLARTLQQRYGKDRTFSVPILTALAIAGRLGPDGWRVVPQLPFELAACPPAWFASLRLPVVSYALPALIAIGQARHAARPTRNPVSRALRNAARRRTLETLQAIQPVNGGFLEATPLTSFVVMSVAAAGGTDLAVVDRGVAFLVASVRDDGSWPIDTNLSTWATTLSIGALAAGGSLAAHLDADERSALRDWLIGQQSRSIHAYTQAAPGGWAWTDLPGGVPDADDTAGAVLALRQLAPPGEGPTRAAAAAGVRWLLDLQNRDGGVPTFCRGWSGLPFDRSGADLTAHAVQAWLAWRAELPDAQPAIDRALAAALRFLRAAQRHDGAFEPLWFGNERATGELNLTYGTAKVLPALVALASHGLADAREMAARAARWLCEAQHADGGWGGDRAAAVRSIEETALAVAALADVSVGIAATGRFDIDAGCIARGVDWLRQATDEGRAFPPSPIGLYFAKLWYSERLYPMIFTVAALEAASRLTPSARVAASALERS